MLKKVIFVALIVLAALSGVLVAKMIADPPNYAPVAQTGGMVVSNPRVIPDYRLVDMNGKPFELSSLRGKSVFVFFGYTFCPDVCPLTLAELKQVKALLGPQAANTVFLYVSVDPERDTPAVLKTYVTAFDPEFLAVTGDIDTVRRFATEFGAAFEKQRPEGTSATYLVNHTAFTYLLDADGKWRMTFAYRTPVDAVARDAGKYIAR
ncbi:MAG: SCO family protein [Thermoflexales bacterium]|nr:SCO family protein [Thermoflexales bacterium]